MEITTRRLRLVLQTREEVEQMIAAMPEADRAQVSPDWLARMRASTVANPWVYGFRVLLRDTSEAVGSCGFKGLPADGIVEIAYSTDAAHTGKGYATGAAQALADYAASRSEVCLIRAHTLPDGSASKCILAKCGFRYVGEVIDPEDGPVSRFEKPCERGS
jgi:[ribosomal protein S5]-alanine N-acetyltransferase